MGRIITTVDIQNLAASGLSKKIDAFVDTGASYLTLPSAWKEQFGSFGTEELVELETATQQVVEGSVCGPVKIKVEGFRAVYNEVLLWIWNRTVVNTNPCWVTSFSISVELRWI